MNQYYLERVYNQLINLFRLCALNEDTIYDLDTKFDHIHLNTDQYCTFGIPGFFYCEPLLPFKVDRPTRRSPIVMEIYKFDESVESAISEVELHYYRCPDDLDEEYVYIYGFDTTKTLFKRWRYNIEEVYNWWIPIVTPRKNRYVFRKYILFIQYLLGDRDVLSVLDELVLNLM